MATNMKSLNGYGFDASALGGKAPEYYLQPRNLLDNSFWRRGSEIVNQRGQTSYIGAVYGIDRWYGRAEAQKTEVRSIDITVTATGTPYAGIKQKIANIEEFAGETVTLAVYVYSTVHVAVGFVNENDEAVSETVDSSTGARVILCNCTVPSDATPDTFIPRILLRTTAQNDYMRCYWAALYEGTYTVDTLPPYVPKGYAAELAECQRYYYKMSNTTAFYGLAGSSNNTAYAYFDLPRAMRTTPSYTSPSKFYIYSSDGSIETKTIQALMTHGRQVEVSLSVTWITAGIALTGYIDGSMSLSADL